MSLPTYLRDDCRGLRNMGIAVINGTADPIVPYDGGQIDVLGQRRDWVMSTDETMQVFSGFNGCSGEPVTTRIGNVDRLDWQSCKAATVLYRVNGGGHSWPGDATWRKKRQGGVNRDINAADEIWTIFSQF